MNQYEFDDLKKCLTDLWPYQYAKAGPETWTVIAKYLRRYDLESVRYCCHDLKATHGTNSSPPLSTIRARCAEAAGPERGVSSDEIDVSWATVQRHAMLRNGDRRLKLAPNASDSQIASWAIDDLRGHGYEARMVRGAPVPCRQIEESDADSEDEDLRGQVQELYDRLPTDQQKAMVRRCWRAGVNGASVDHDQVHQALLSQYAEGSDTPATEGSDE